MRRRSRPLYELSAAAALTALTTVFPPPPRNDSYIGPSPVFALKPIGVVWSVLLMRENHRAVSDRTGIPSHSFEHSASPLRSKASAAADVLCQ